MIQEDNDVDCNGAGIRGEGRKKEKKKMTKGSEACKTIGKREPEVHMRCARLEEGCLGLGNFNLHVLVMVPQRQRAIGGPLQQSR